MRRLAFAAESWVTLAVLLVSSIVLINAQGLPEGSFDPLGPGAAPKMVAAVLILLCSILLVRSAIRGRSGHAIREEGPIDIVERTAEPTPRAFLWFLGLLFLYILAFHLELTHFVVATSLFVFFAMLALGGATLRMAIIGALTGITLSILLFLILTKFFVIRLPGAF